MAGSRASPGVNLRQIARTVSNKNAGSSGQLIANGLLSDMPV